MSKEALDLALEALEKSLPRLAPYGEQDWLDSKAAITAIKQARSAPVQEPVAWVDWLPEGTTHIAKCKATTSSGGSLSLRTHAFKYEADVLKVYTTDNDNEYPGWRAAKDVFYHLNFAIVPLYTTPPAANRPWFGLTDEEILAANYPDGEENEPTISAPNFELDCFAKQVEAKLKEKNNG